jgi:hypothetical protein
MSLGRVKLTIEMLDVPDSKIVTLEYPNGSIILERGHTVVHDPVGGHVSDIRPNGQRRVRIDLWEGCPSYNDFKGKT